MRLVSPRLLESRTVGAWLAAFALAIAGCTHAPVPSRPLAWHSTTLGLCEDYPEETRTFAHARSDLAAAHAAGAQVLRIAFGWDSIEAQPGHYDWSFWDDYVRAAVDDYSLTLIPYVCYTPKWAASDQGENYWRSPPRDPAAFGRFMSAIVAHYRNRIHSWELWNEPDNQAYWLGTPPQFAALIHAGSAAVRAADPHARIVLGGIAGELDFLEQVLRDGHTSADVDVVNIHSYFETWHPNPIERLPEYIAEAENVVHLAGGNQPLWMAETGYSSVGDRADISSVYRPRFRGEHTEAAQAEALARTLLTSLGTAQLQLIAWYRINDLAAGQAVIGDDNNFHLGIRHVDGTPKPAYGTFAFLAHLFEQPYAVLAPNVTVAPGASGRPEARAFRLRDGRVVVAAWLATPAELAGPPSQPDTRAATVKLVLPETRARRVVWYDATGRATTYPDSGWENDRGQFGIRCGVRGAEVRIAVIEP